MASSLTERRTGTAGLHSTGTAGSCAGSPRGVEHGLDQRADLSCGNDFVGDTRRDDLPRMFATGKLTLARLPEEATRSHRQARRF